MIRRRTHYIKTKNLPWDEHAPRPCTSTGEDAGRRVIYHEIPVDDGYIVVLARGYDHLGGKYLYTDNTTKMNIY